jgi:spermidine/putrescine transport system permease protein
MKNKLFRTTSIFYVLLIYLFLYLPIAVLIIFSFNKSKLNAVWTGFTFDWYNNLINDSNVIDSMVKSLIVAFVSTALSTMVGTITAVGMYKYKFKGKSVLDSLLYIPIVIPEIVMGISLLAFFSLTNVALGLTTIILAHVTFSIPYVVVVVKSRLDGFDKAIEEAAMDLGASHMQTFIKVTMPVIMPGIVAGALLAFTLSLDDVIISFFVAGPSCVTLPMRVFSMVRTGVTPEINALSTIMVVVTLTVAVVAERIKASSTK